MSKEKVLLNLIRVCGLLGVLAFVIAKSPYPSWMEWACPGNLDYGSNYREAKVRHFKVKLPKKSDKPVPATDKREAHRFRIFVMGDSFFASDWGHDPFVRQLAERLGEPVFNAGWDDRNPACLFSESGTSPPAVKKRIVLLESVEGAILDRLSRVTECSPRAEASPPAVEMAMKLFDVVFKNNEKRLRFLFHNSAVTAPIVELWNTMLFSLFGILPDETPTYSLDPLFLFTQEESRPGLRSSFYHPHEDAAIETLAVNLRAIADRLKAGYNAELVFMPVPHQYTLYHKLVNDDPYDDYLPRLCDALERRGVRTIRLYERFKTVSEPLFPPTDFHWNALGVSIALDETLRTFEAIR